MPGPLLRPTRVDQTWGPRHDRPCHPAGLVGMTAGPQLAKMTSRTLRHEGPLSTPLHCPNDPCTPPLMTAAAPLCPAVKDLHHLKHLPHPGARREGAPVHPHPHLRHLHHLPHPPQRHLPQSQPSGKRRKGSCPRGRFPVSRAHTLIRIGIATRICPSLSESIRHAQTRKALRTRCRQVTSAQMSLFIHEAQGLARLFPKTPEDKET